MPANTQIKTFCVSKMLPKGQRGGIALGYFNKSRLYATIKTSSGIKTRRVKMDDCYLFDNDLSLKAKGILSVLLENKNINSKQQLVDLSVDGRDSVDSGIKELEEKGYLRIERIKSKGQLYKFETSPTRKFLK